MSLIPSIIYSYGKVAFTHSTNNFLGPIGSVSAKFACLRIVV